MKRAASNDEGQKRRAIGKKKVDPSDDDDYDPYVAEEERHNKAMKALKQKEFALLDAGIDYENKRKKFETRKAEIDLRVARIAVRKRDLEESHG
jgi:hypothetical protein